MKLDKENSLMINNPTETHTPDDQNILARYRLAEAWEHENFTASMVLHARVFPHWIGDSHRFWYSHINKTSTEYRLVDAEADTNTIAFDHKKLALVLANMTGEPVLDTALPLANLDFSGVSFSFDAFGKSWQFREDFELTETGLTSAHPAHWLVSPDGKKAVFIKDYNLWLHDMESGNEHALTTDGVRHHSYATQTEGRDLVGGLEGTPEPAVIPEALWSPDSSQLFTVQLDERLVGTMPSILYAPQDGSLRPRVIERKYALPGDTHIPEYRFLILDASLDTSMNREIAADYPPVEDSFLWCGVFSGNRAWWSGDGKKTYFLDMARGQKSVRVLEMLANSGQTRVLFEEQADTYLEMGHNLEAPTVLIPIPATDELIWFSQRSGFAHLYLYDLKTGNVKNAITSGEWSISTVVHFDVERREVWVQLMGRVTGRDFYYREVARIQIDNGEITLIASSDHDYDVYLSPNSEYVVSTHSRIDTASVTELRDRNGKVLSTLEKTDLSALPIGWQWPEPFKTIAADGKTLIYGAIFRPTDFDPDKSYPVLNFGSINSFHAAVPKQAFSGYFETAAAFAELGIIVVMMDGRGTSFRDKAFRDYGYGNFIESGGIVDWVAGTQQLAERYPYMDLNRVGVFDFDGSNAGVTGLLAFPEFYSVGVASSLYDPRLVRQGEVYMGLTTEEKRNQAVVWSDSINNLKGNLLIITGLRDRYFHPSTTFQLTDALCKANKDFEHVVQPNGGHCWRVMNGRRRIWDFLVKHLLGVNPPPEFKLVTGIEIAVPYQMTEVSM
jgi:dipeptidyl aminopeptidase/acylaminoacyl peptidase